MSAPRGTTPTLTLTFTDQGLDLTAADKVYVTFDFGGEQLTKESEDLTIGAKTIGVHLTQAETLAFPEGSVDIQVNWLIDAERYASEVVRYPFSRQLIDEVLP